MPAALNKWQMMEWKVFEWLTKVVCYLWFECVRNGEVETSLLVCFIKPCTFTFSGIIPFRSWKLISFVAIYWYAMHLVCLHCPFALCVHCPRRKAASADIFWHFSRLAATPFVWNGLICIFSWVGFLAEAAAALALESESDCRCKVAPQIIEYRICDVCLRVCLPAMEDGSN